MRSQKLMTVLISLCLATITAGSDLQAQVSPERLEAIRARMQQLRALFDKVPQERRSMFSSGALNLLQLAQRWEKLEPSLRAQKPEKFAGAFAAAARVTPSLPSQTVAVSNPATDFLFSVQTGSTQSETSTAWCGNNVVVGFNDSGSIAESILFGPGGISFTGVAFSRDQGMSFRDIGFVNPGANPLNSMAGDPVLGCASPSIFHYSQLFFTGSLVAPLSAVALSTSVNGGAAWGDPVTAVSKDGFSHLLDKDWMAVDPTDPRRLFVTYTDFDVSGACGPADIRNAIELVTSTNGGTTWGSPTVVEEVCSPFSVPGLFPEGSQVAVGPSGEVYVAWEFFEGDFFTRSLHVRKSTDHGSSFGPDVKIADVTAVGDGETLQGLFRINEFPSLAVDRSGGSTRGNVYVTWNDGGNFNVPSFTVSGLYGYADVVLSRSTDGGQTWSNPVRVNTNREPSPNGQATDQFMPAIAVDSTGKLGACWYDRRLDSLNYRVDRFCGVSSDAGASWTNNRQSSPSWEPIHNTDFQIVDTYMGDYDGMADDFTQSNSGFIGAFQQFNSKGVPVSNPDVKATSFQ
jgi:hypothetical protein